MSDERADGLAMRLNDVGLVLRGIDERRHRLLGSNGAARAAPGPFWMQDARDLADLFAELGEEPAAEAISLARALGIISTVREQGLGSDATG